ncbi:MAG TPA: HEAT repeat domain-containing protein [Vicinamibacterales bacterium]|nr:HEAT repeat domain-containing protein [Vicinamibacterales bacterium]HPK71396.1 HEAT repeat domain-containing protein [Vicinamibacterales bacterium]
MTTITLRRFAPGLAAARAVFLASALLASASAAVTAQPAAAPSSLDAILKALATHDGGIESAPVWSLRDYVYARKDDPAGRAECEAALLAFLKTPATPPAKLAAARYLRVVAGDTAVPALRALLLADARTADCAIAVLQRLPGPAADDALAGALKPARGAVKTALVAALGERRSAAALPALVPLLAQPALAEAAATAIGRIGGAGAVSALMPELTRAAGPFKQAVAAALLAAADQMRASGDFAGALPAFRRLASDTSLPSPLRTAAFMGEIGAGEEGAAGLLLTMLDSADPDERQAAVAKIADAVPAEGIGPVCDRLRKLPEALQVQVLAALTGYPRVRVLGTVLWAARSESPEVRVAALRALAQVGDASIVPFLVERAASAPRGPEQDAARSALAAIRGRDVDDAVVGLLDRKPAPAAAVELLKAIGERRVFTAKPAVAAALADEPSAVRIEALKALRAIGSPSDVSPVLDLLVGTRDDSEQAEAEKTVAALLQKIGAPDGRSRLLRARLLATQEPAERARLLALLPLVGDDGSLPVLRKALGDSDGEVAGAAARAIAAWPTVTARDDVLRLARGAKDDTHTLLALAGLVRLIGLEPNRLPEAAVADLRQAADLASRPEERKLVLGVLAAFPCEAAFEFARGFLQDEAVKAEAQAAIDAMTQRLAKGPAR